MLAQTIVSPTKNYFVFSNYNFVINNSAFVTLYYKLHINYILYLYRWDAHSNICHQIGSIHSKNVDRLFSF